MSFNEKLLTLLKSDPRFVDKDGDLLKSEVIDKAWKIDRHLIELLLDDEQIKAKFFDEIKGHWVFNINTFIDYIQDKNFYDSSYTKFRNKIGLTIDGKFLKERGEVALVWPYKDCILEGGQTKEEEKRKEIFFNEVLAQDEIDRLLDPKVLTNFKRYTVNGEEKVTEIKRDKDGTIRENLIVKGNNLLALHTLKTQFRGKIKLIYIDPPYNTGNDSFGYNDSFNHSTWLTFMKNRMEIARELLKKDGVIFISCDDNEQAYLKIVCDEVFRRENFIATMPWKGRGGRQDAQYISDIHEFILFYVINKNSFTAGAEIKDDDKFPKLDELKNRQYKTQLLRKWGSNSKKENRPNLFYAIYSPDGKEVFPILPDGSEGCWRWGQNRMQREIKDGNIEFIKQNNGEIIAYQKIYAPIEGEHSTKKFASWIDNEQDFWLDKIGSTAEGSKELEKLFGYKPFNYPKPVSLIKHLLKIGNLQDDDIVLDFFPGSGTTAHATIQFAKDEGVNVQFILCEQMNYIEIVTCERIKRVIKQNDFSDFIFIELMKYNEAFTERIRASENIDTLLAIWEDMKAHSFLNYNVDIKKMDENIEAFKELPVAKQKETLMDILNKNQLYVNLSEIEDQDFKVSDEDKKLNRLFYGV